MTKNYVVPTVWDFSENGVRSSDIFSKLLENRIIFLNGEVNEITANLITAQLLFLESVDAEEDVWLYINSPGGSCIDGLQIIDTMRFIKPKVGTIVTGMAASMGFAILTAGEKGMRFALPNAQIMAHRVSSGAGGHVEDMRISFEHSMHIDTILAQLIADNIGMKKETYLNHVIRDKWLTANESLTFGKKGVIDRIITTRNEL